MDPTMLAQTLVNVAQNLMNNQQQSNVSLDNQSSFDHLNSFIDKMRNEEETMV